MKKTQTFTAALITALLLFTLLACGDPENVPSGGVLNFAELDTAIANANAAKTGVVISVNGSDVSPAQQWVTQTAVDALDNTITAAETVKAQAATQAAVDAAVTALNGAVATFNSLKSPGTEGVTLITSVAITVAAPSNGGTPATTATGTGNFTIGTVTWSPAHNPFHGREVYNATVTLTADDGYTFTGLSAATINGETATMTNNTGAAITLSRAFPQTDTREVVGLLVLSQPVNLTYNRGDPLNLTGISVQIHYNTGDPDTVFFAQFDARNITTNPAHSDPVSIVLHNGQPVTVSLGVFDGFTNNLTVNPLVPTAPQNLQASTEGSTATLKGGQIVLTWETPADDGGGSIIRYEVSSDNGGTWANASSNNSHTFDGLEHDTEYNVAVRAVNSAGNSPQAATKATTPDPCVNDHTLNAEKGICIFCNALAYKIGDIGPGGGRIYYAADGLDGRPLGFFVQGYTGAGGATSSFASYTAHYLEAAPENSTPATEGGEYAQWSILASIVSGVTTFTSTGDALANTIGNGRKDTQYMLTRYNAGAARIAIDATFGGRNDWFLPSSGELNQLYINRAVVGNMGTSYFWSSSQRSGEVAWGQVFSDGSQYYYSKISTLSVRAVRAF